MNAKWITALQLLAGCALGPAATVTGLYLLLQSYPQEWVFATIALDSLLIGDLLSFFFDKIKPAVMDHPRSSFLLFFGLTVVVGIFGAWAGSILGPYIEGPFPTVSFGQLVVTGFMVLTVLLVLIDTLLKYFTFRPELELSK